MNSISHIIDIISNNPLYLILIASLSIMIIWSLIKKLFKLAIIFSVCSIVYVVYIYSENPRDIEKKRDEILREGQEILREGQEILERGANIVKERFDADSITSKDK